MTDQCGKQRLFTSGLCQGIFLNFFLTQSDSLFFFTCFAQAGVFYGFEAHIREYTSSKSDSQSIPSQSNPIKQPKSSVNPRVLCFFPMAWNMIFFFFFPCIFVPDKIPLSKSLNWSRWAFPTSGRADWKCQRSPFVLSNTKVKPAHIAGCIYIFPSTGVLIHCFHLLLGCVLHTWKGRWVCSAATRRSLHHSKPLLSLMCIYMYIPYMYFHIGAPLWNWCLCLFPCKTRKELWVLPNEQLPTRHMQMFCRHFMGFVSFICWDRGQEKQVT